MTTDDELKSAFTEVGLRIKNLSTNLPIHVAYGTNLNAARPNTPRPAYWFGQGEPVNALPGDVVFSTVEISEPVGFVGAFDSYAAPFRAHSLRRVRSAYAGPLIRVRRSSDNTEADISYLANGDLDSAALLAFAGSGSAFVSNFYDQSGNARHTLQATAAAQPRIVNAGVLDTLNGKPSLVFDGTDDYLTSSAAGLYAAGVTTLASVMAGASAANATVFSETKTDSNGSFYRMLRSSTQAWHIQAANDTGASLWATAASGSVIFDNLGHQLFYTDSGSLISTWKDTVAAHAAFAATRSGVVTMGRFNIGAHNGTSVSNFLNGKVQEVVAWTSDLTASRTAISAEEKAYWGTP